MSVSQIARRATKLVSDNSPLILTVIGVTGTVATAVFASQATVKATRILDDEELARKVADADSLTPKERFKIVWKLYVPATTTCILTISAIVGANRIGARRTAALAAAYSISERAFVEYKDHVIEHIGAKEEKKVRDKLAQTRVNQAADRHAPLVIPADDDGEVWCYDAWSGRYFKSSMNDLQRAENRINSQINHADFATVDEFWDFLDPDVRSDSKHKKLPSTDISGEMGWNTSNPLELDISTTMYKDRFPCLAVSFATVPVRNPWQFQ